MQFAYQFLPAGFFLRLCRARMAAGLFPPLLSRFSARKTHLKKKVKKQLTKAFLHDRINKSSGERTQKVNMGVFPSGQWGQTVNLLLSASVVRIHPRPPKEAQRTKLRWAFCFARHLKSHSRGWMRTAAATSLKMAQKQPGGLFFSSAARDIHPRPPKNLNVCKYAEVFVLLQSQTHWAGGFEQLRRHR